MGANFKVGDKVVGYIGTNGYYEDNTVTSFQNAIDYQNQRYQLAAINEYMASQSKATLDLSYKGEQFNFGWSKKKKNNLFDDLGLIPISGKFKATHIFYNTTFEDETYVVGGTYSGTVSSDGDVSIHEDLDEYKTGRKEATCTITKIKEINNISISSEMLF